MRHPVLQTGVFAAQLLQTLCTGQGGQGPFALGHAQQFVPQHGIAPFTHRLLRHHGLVQGIGVEQGHATGLQGDSIHPRAGLLAAGDGRRHDTRAGMETERDLTALGVGHTGVQQPVQHKTLLGLPLPHVKQHLPWHQVDAAQTLQYRRQIGRRHRREGLGNLQGQGLVCGGG